MEMTYFMERRAGNWIYEEPANWGAIRTSPHGTTHSGAPADAVHSGMPDIRRNHQGH